ncbi:MAG: hypothetical protein ACLQGP_08050 [Isosphaeraceae bacterium]
MWRFRGSPHYIDQQGNRLGVSKILTDQARHNQEMYRVSVLVGQLCERYYRTPKDGGRAIVYPAELAQVQGTLGQCELELEKLHVLAAAAQVIIDEAHRAFGLTPPSRHFRVRCDFDDLADAGMLVPEEARTAIGSPGKGEGPLASTSDPTPHAKPKHAKAR